MNGKDPEQRVSGIENLATDLEPGRDLWPGIRDRLGPRKRWPEMIRPAAAAVVLVAMGVLVALITLQQEPGPAVIVPAVREHPGSHAGYFAQRRAFAMQVTAGDTRLDARTRAALTKDLAAVESAIESIQRALHDDPNNPALQRLLNESYRTEAEVMNAAVRAQAQTPTRSDL